MMSRYEILKVISKGGPTTLQSIYGEIKEKNKDKEADAGSLIEALVSLVSEGLIDEHEGGPGVTYVLTTLGKKALNELGEQN